MRQPNYNRLHYFWTVARGVSVTRASQELGVAQPTVTRQLRSLEAELGDRLFTRAGRGLVLSDAPVAPTSAVRGFGDESWASATTARS